MNKIILLFLILSVSIYNLEAQELKATVSVNSSRIQSTNKNVFTTMERSMNQFINGTSWSNTTFSANERIDCTFSLTIVEQPADNNFKAELFIQARRPVYNSSYQTSVLNFRDANVEFEYTENAPLEIVQTSINNNLVAITAFYCNLILALDFDSFSPSGGSVFFRQAQSIATQAQSNSGWTGWSAFDDNRSRTSIVNAYLDESLKPIRELAYTYHRKGLDEMAANPDRARTTILNALPVLKDIRVVRNSEIILQMFADCKLDEIVSLSEKATSEEKKNTYDLLRSVFPASSMQLDPLKK
jgi:Flp pilus assembly protein TadG